ncbi:unnamed protein product [Heterobilharzia americana]|nr:unnamed protein product [Heterobilharzia americana]
MSLIRILMLPTGVRSCQVLIGVVCRIPASSLDVDYLWVRIVAWYCMIVTLLPFELNVAVLILMVEEEIGSHCMGESLRCCWGHHDRHSKTQCARGCRQGDNIGVEY